jgi:hypothetical protein
MVLLLGSFQQTLHILFLVRYSVLQPAWMGLKDSGLALVLHSLVSLLGAVLGTRLPLE